jgi:hypothetical protein
MINLVPHAVFHFEQRCGYARAPFPAPDPSSGWIHSNELLGTRELFFPKATNSEQTDAGNWRSAGAYSLTALLRISCEKESMFASWSERTAKSRRIKPALSRHFG